MFLFFSAGIKFIKLFIKLPVIIIIKIIGIGIDLGTTNSSVAVMENGSLILKSYHRLDLYP
ncbi:hypothetical protein CXF71_14105 [Colwellia sp. 12G3]|nr:hypothetical protein CXF71_14105 [Colwellia sp. 12G3]